MRERLADVNPDVEVVTFNEPITSANAFDIMQGLRHRRERLGQLPHALPGQRRGYLLGKPLVDGTLFRFEGRANVFLPGKGCYRCLFPAPPPPGAVPSCAEAGVLGAMCGVIGTIQAVETIKLILDLGEPLVNRLMLFDSLSMEFREVRIPRDPELPAVRRQPDHPRADRLRGVLRRAGDDPWLSADGQRTCPGHAAADGRRRAQRRRRRRDAARADRQRRPAPPGLRRPAARDRAVRSARFVNIYVNDEDVRYLKGLDTPVGEGDVISILPAVAGGR